MRAQSVTGLKQFVSFVAAVLTSSCCTSLPKVPAKRVPDAPPAPPERAVQSNLADLGAVPVRIYVPAGDDRVPVVLVSHGIGEDRDSYVWLGRRLAASGFMAVHPTHAGTDRAVLERGYRHLYRATKDPENWRRRPRDVSAILDALTSHPRADVTRAAVVGHSAGAFTAFAVAGLRAGTGESLADPRVKVIVPMSMVRIPASYEGISIPVLNITGTCDTSLIYRTFPKHRRIPFESSRGQHLLTFERVNHDTFSAAQDPHHDEIGSAVIAFLRGYLLGDEAARRWFEDPGSAPGLTLERN
jgi:dienelactone hydrolase